MTASHGENERLKRVCNQLQSKLAETEAALRESENIRQKQAAHIRTHDEVLRQVELEKSSMINKTIRDLREHEADLVQRERVISEKVGICVHFNPQERN